MKSVRCSVPDGQDVSPGKIYSAALNRAPEHAHENLSDFHGAESHPPASIYTMQSIDASYEPWPQPVGPAAFRMEKEPKLKLSLETVNRGDVIIVHCQGRIVYRDEAAALSRVVGDVLLQSNKLVLDLSGVSSIDSAGIGDLALLQTWAQDRNVAFKCAAPNLLVRNLLELTNLDSVLEVHPSLDAAIESFREEEEGVCANC
jgi:anti-sigma B factor antagonist